jgi:hypothetical protein
MKKATLTAVLTVLWAASCTMAQSTSVSVFVLGGPNIENCSDGGATDASCSVSWTSADGLISGNGTTSAIGGYGSLQGYVSVNITAQEISSGYYTAGQAGADFNDTLTFIGLNQNAYLRVTETLTGSASGDLGYATTAASAVLEDDLNVVDCTVETFKGTCTTTLPIFPGDTVSLSGQLGTGGDAVEPQNATGSDFLTLNYQVGTGKTRRYGATTSLVVVDSTGKPLKGVTIVAASGTIYPAK